MHCPGFFRRVWRLACVPVLTAAAFAQGYAPEDAPSKMTLASGLEAQLVACEPMVRQPVAIEFDDRGRLWVIQYLQYPNPEGLKRVKVDRYSRTQYDRVPEPPPGGPKGNDAITILEDADGDGRMDRGRNFVEGLNLCTGLAFGYGGVFVIQAPYLLFYSDRDRDDVPDGDPEVLLTGFGMEDAHSVANSLTWGPDGWLYGLQGSTVTANINGIEFQQGVWRYHPRTRQFELFCEGGGNMWGLDFDWQGNLFACTNVGPYVMLHGVQGGYYWKQFGKHGALHNPYAYGYFEHATHHNPEGGHVTVGGIIYESDGLPEVYYGSFIAANLLSHNVYWHTLQQSGSTFETFNRGKVMDSNDTWFAPSDMTLGPDGALYIADWCDKRTAHPDPDATWDRSNGRIYRIATKGLPSADRIDVAAMKTRRLLAILDDPNKWFVRRALVQLGERRDAGICNRLAKRITKNASSRQAVTSLFALNLSGGFDDSTAARVLDHPEPAVRKWAVRLLGELPTVSADTGRLLLQRAELETDPLVRSQLASTARRLTPSLGIEMVRRMIESDRDAADPHIPLLLWWAIERYAMSDPEAVLAAIESIPQETKLLRETVLPRLVRRYAADGSVVGDSACLRLLAASGRTELLVAVDEGLQDRNTTQTGAALGTLFADYAQTASTPAADSPAAATPVAETLRNYVVMRRRDAPDDPVLLRLATRMGDEDAYAHAKMLAGDSAKPEAVRLAAVEALGRFGKRDCAPVLIELVAQSHAPALRPAALDAVRRIPDDAVARSLMSLYPTLDHAMKEKVRDALFARTSSSALFVAAVEQGTIPASEVPLDQVRLMANHNDPSLLARVEKIWGAVRAGTPEEKLAEMRRLNNELNAGKGDPEKGRAVFAQNCAKCHQLFGEGFNVGPDLTQSNRMDREYLLVSLVDPNLTIRKEYMQYIVETRDEGLFNGLIAERTPGSVTLVNASNVRTTVPADQIVDLREADTSLMPEGLVTPLSGDDLRDLFAYLQSPGPEGTK